jgi:hypothetical protein
VGGPQRESPHTRGSYLPRRYAGAAGTDRDYFTIIRDLIGGFDKERCAIGDSPRPAVTGIKKKLAEGDLGVQRDGN